VGPGDDCMARGTAGLGLVSLTTGSSSLDTLDLGSGIICMSSLLVAGLGTCSAGPAVLPLLTRSSALSSFFSFSSEDLVLGVALIFEVEAVVLSELFVGGTFIVLVVKGRPDGLVDELSSFEGFLSASGFTVAGLMFSNLRAGLMGRTGADERVPG